jgi:hypothetical protein
MRSRRQKEEAVPKVDLSTKGAASLKYIFQKGGYF